MSSTNGARHTRVEEPLSWAEEYPIQWREPLFDLAELAKRRWIEGLSRKELARVYGRTECAIQNHFQELKRRGLRVPGLTDDEREKILWALKS
jgi:hypothetical protein